MQKPMDRMEDEQEVVEMEFADYYYPDPPEYNPPEVDFIYDSRGRR